MSMHSRPWYLDLKKKAPKFAIGTILALQKCISVNIKWLSDKQYRTLILFTTNAFLLMN